MAKQFFLYIGVCFLFYACSPAMISVKQEVSKLSLEEMENPYNLTMRQHNDSDYSAIQRTVGLFRIGDVKINLAKFKLLDPNFNVSSLSFSDSLIYTAIVRVRGSSSSEDYQEDTVLMRGENIVKWEGLKNVVTEANQEPWKIKSETKGFGNDCPPSICTHYFIAITKSGYILNASNIESLGNMIPVVKSPYDAMFYIALNTYFAPARFAKTRDGYLILLNKSISDCPIDYADILYQVDRYGKVKELGRVITRKTALCH
jgi:hypothetical protein